MHGPVRRSLVSGGAQVAEMRISQSELELCYVNAEIAAMAETKAAAKYPPPHTHTHTHTRAHAHPPPQRTCTHTHADARTPSAAIPRVRSQCGVKQVYDTNDTCRGTSPTTWTIPRKDAPDHLG